MLGKNGASADKATKSAAFLDARHRLVIFKIASLRPSEATKMLDDFISLESLGKRKARHQSP